MAKKRTKADRLQQQIERLERVADRGPEEIEKKEATLEDVNDAATRTLRKAAGDR
jgi:hypothetical protein